MAASGTTRLLSNSTVSLATNTSCPGSIDSSTHTAAWPAILLLTVAVGGMYTNAAMCVSLKRDWSQLRHKGFYPYLLSLAVGDMINCIFIMPMAVIHTILGWFPGSQYLCQAWYAGDLWLTSALGLHLCVLAMDLGVNVGPGRYSCFFASPTDTCMVLKLTLVWMLSAATAIGPLMWYYTSTHGHMMCPTCLPTSLEVTVISSTLCFFVPVVLLLGTYLACVAMVVRRKGCHGNSEVEHCLEGSHHGNCNPGQPDIEQLKKDVQNFTSLSADLNLSPSPAPKARHDNDIQHLLLEKSPSSGLKRTLSSLSRRLSSKKTPASSTDQTPSSPKLDRHPSLRYSIKRGTPSSMRSSRRQGSPEPGQAEGCSMPLLLAATSGVCGESLDVCRPVEELDDQTICDMLLAASPPDKAGSPTSGSSTKRWGSRRNRGSSKRHSKKGSLTTTPSSPTLDRHPSLRYSIKRPRTSEESGGSKKGFSRSPSARSQRSFFSRSPSQRSTVSRTPSQRSYGHHSPFNRSPQPLKSSPLLTDTSHGVKAGQHDTVFHFPDHSHHSNHGHQQSPGTSTHSTSLHSPEISTHSEQESVISHYSSAQSEQADIPYHIQDTKKSHSENTESCLEDSKPVRTEVELDGCVTTESSDIPTAEKFITKPLNDSSQKEIPIQATQLRSPVLVVQQATPIKTITEPFLDIYTHKINTGRKCNDFEGHSDLEAQNNVDNRTKRLQQAGALEEDGQSSKNGQVQKAEEGNIITSAATLKVQDESSADKVDASTGINNVSSPQSLSACPYKPQDLQVHASVAKAHSIESLEHDVAVIPQGSPLSVLTAPPWRATPTDLAHVSLMTKLLGVLTVCFILTHLPTFISVATWASSSCPGNTCTFYFAFQWLSYLCSFLNPIVFFAFHRHLIQRLRYC